MHPFNAIGHALTTLPTGGFSPENRGVEIFAAPSQWVITFFMIVAGTNFALTYRALTRREPAVFPATTSSASISACWPWPRS